MFEIDEGLSQFQRMTPDLLPISTLASPHFGYDLAAQIGDFAFLGPQEESGLVGDQMEPAKLLALFPSDPAVSRTTLEYSAWPAS